MRLIVLFAALLALLAGGPGGAVGRAAESESPIDPRLSGYPELLISIFPDGVEAPAVVAAGRTLVVEENLTEEEAHVFVLRIPDDVIEAQLAVDLGPDAPSAEEYTPEWFYRGHLVGNPDRAAPGGGRVYGLVDLIPGRYAVVDPLHAGRIARFVVEAAPSAPAPARPDPRPDVVAEMFEMDFALPETVPAGRQIWRVDSRGAILHEIALMPIPAGATEADVAAVMGALFAGQAVPATAGAEWTGWTYSLVGGVGASSPGVSVWAQLDLEPGSYAAICFIPGAKGPHLMEGMIELFSVEDAGGVATGPLDLASLARRDSSPTDGRAYTDFG
jgi:hypothetical protein